jgi:hypothetical protein
MPHQPLVMAFARNGMDLPCLCECGGHSEFDISDEGFHRGQSSIASSRAIAALFFDVSEKVENQSSVDLLDTDLGRLDPEPLTGKDEQEPKGVSVGLAGVGTATLLDRHVFAQKTGNQWGDRCHTSSPAIRASAAAAMPVISAGVASRYQYVWAISVWPMYVARATK